MSLDKQAAETFLQGLKIGLNFHQVICASDPSPANLAKLEDIKKAIATIEAHAATLPLQAKRVVPPMSKYDPIKAAADRAEQRSAKGRKP